MRRRTGWAALASLVVLLALVAAGCGGDDDEPEAAENGGTAAATGGGAQESGPITIGWAYDSSGQMAPFDGPALAAAKIRAEEINGKGGVNGRDIEIKTCDTQNNDPAKAKACATSLLDGGADIMFVTCDVDFATPVVQEAIGEGKLAIAPCIGTDQMDGGPRHEHAARLLQERRRGVRQALHGARRQGRRQGELRDRGEQRQRGRQPAQQREGGRRRDLDGLR
jgi:hypothetical protein